MSTEKITPERAEALAKQAVGNYLNACGLVHRDQMGDVLMKLASVVGVMMAANEGSEAAFDRLLGTAQFILQTMPKTAAAMRPMQ